MPIVDADTLSDFDLLQLVDLDTKANWEGSLRYAVENWSWLFDSDVLTEAMSARDVDAFRAALRATQARRDAWWAAHPHPTQIGPLEAHEAEVARREEDVTT